MSPTTLQILGAALFGVAVLHTFSTSYFERLAQRHPRHAGIWHLLGEVEVVFGFWAMVLVAWMFAIDGQAAAIRYLDSRNFTEPMFVFAIMVVAATRPVTQFAAACAAALARRLPLPANIALYAVVLSVVPLLGSFITEPAAMTLAALILRDSVYCHRISRRLKYATLATLFVNVSIGGTLTSFAAPPVLMVAGKWGWDTPFMLAAFSWKAALAVGVNAALAAFWFRKELARIDTAAPPVLTAPLPLVLVHVMLMATMVAFAHHPALFMGAFLFFLGVAQAYRRHQDRLVLKEALLVASFLAGLVVLGGLQAWWLRPVLMHLNADAVFYGAAALTAVTDNAALTYLASQVTGLPAQFQTALVAGAVAGGGLSLIANAPNPAGAAILRDYFDGGAVRADLLLAGALAPTAIALCALGFL